MLVDVRTRMRKTLKTYVFVLGLSVVVIDDLNALARHTSTHLHWDWLSWLREFIRPAGLVPGSSCRTAQVAPSPRRELLRHFPVCPTLFSYMLDVLK